MVATTNIDCVPGGSSSRVESQSPKDVVRVCMWDRERESEYYDVCRIYDGAVVVDCGRMSY